ncbi:hypothetical protein COU20_02640 [Candidatus Kaiserbacteria bacterium CG10_big_fil_rev_8_21_14_0_10_59_10]|uniref:TVP38/TMEM64 family membrane protein n=1 Tax=Candidatus Kaiserbacteria bacterium CG10_big_fil_rev_8_21_14_0_10_59_10 TaxID=1974612 RepID=A0A2H0U9N3_9BACT|nr:MAG: hypothetical protein COU20_02640 [Candidatus Kaiserbacteria bacterium CG10_big_fil_rev_8_21_14_0_10_59_10]
MEHLRTLSTRDIGKNLLGLAIVLLGIIFLIRYFNFDAIQARIETAGVWAPALLVLAKAATIIIAPLGGSPLYPLGGALFGFWKGTALLILGDAIGGAVAFFLARVFGRGLVERMLGKSENLLAQSLELMGTARGFLTVRVSFILFQELSAYGAGLTSLPFYTFIFIHVLVGVLPTAFLSALGAVFVAERGVWVILALSGASIGLAFLGLTIFMRMLAKYRAERIGASGHGESGPEKGLSELDGKKG